MCRLDENVDCINEQFGFDCVCDHSEKYPGNTLYDCEFHGLYKASKPVCGRCECDVCDPDKDDIHDILLEDEM